MVAVVCGDDDDGYDGGDDGTSPVGRAVGRGLCPGVISASVCNSDGVKVLINC